MSVLSQTRMSTGGTCSCPGVAASICSNRSFHCEAICCSAPSASRYTTSGFGRLALPGSRSPGSRFSLIAFHSLKYFGSGLPVVSSTGRRGIFTMPLSIASTRPKSLTIHGNGLPSG